MEFIRLNEITSFLKAILKQSSNDSSEPQRSLRMRKDAFDVRLMGQI